ncbi:MAG: hypothetical protein IKO73_00435 [Bacteroidaceae bacterium]|nr:hypothetical protein [Bacteroidaceae bacterium]
MKLLSFLTNLSPTRGVGGVFLFLTLSLSAQEKTTFQTSGPWKPVTDIRSDLVMVYGANDKRQMTFRERVDSWRNHGYTAHFMTGIAWGEYQDYFTGKWDGKWHLDEGQKTAQGDTIWHGRLIPYIIPTKNYLAYFKERHIKPVIDAGIDAIFLEEPEFWARAGYSEAFKREWQEYYGFPWRPQHESAENTYLSNKLKYHLYYRALDEAFTYAKQYGREKGMNIRCYVPTHSLLNYSQWQIVSPEASLASMESCDGYIAQVWTGTSREPNYFNGKDKERVFEIAFLEYGCMESMTRPTGRKMFFLTDPIEDRAKDWEDYKRNYQATFTAQLLYPQIADYEVMPWPDRIYEGLYKVSANNDEKAHIPRFYSTQMQVMINTLNSMPLSKNKVSGSQGISVLMANSLMFQRSPRPVEGYDDPQLSNFYGEALPLLKRGVPVSITHIENVGYAETWKDVRVLLMSYSNMKPLSKDAHTHLAEWVKNGGIIVYSGRDDDPYQRVQEWWNQNGLHYTAPSQHLFSLMGIPEKAEEGVYKYGKGRVYVLRHDPKEYVLKKGGDKQFVDVVTQAYGKLQQKNSFYLERGPYTLVAVLDENVVNNDPFMIKGDYIDLFSPELTYYSETSILPGHQAFFFDLRKINKKRPQVIAAASRQYDEKITKDCYSFTCKSPLNTTNIICLYLPKEFGLVDISCTNAYGKSVSYMARSITAPVNAISHRLLWLTFENSPEGVNVQIEKMLNIQFEDN